MSTLKIKSRKTGETFHFIMSVPESVDSMPIAEGLKRGYVKRVLDSGDVVQCMTPGGEGSTLQAAEKTFDRVVRSWYRGHMKRLAS